MIFFCTGTTKDGAPCKIPVNVKGGKCHYHIGPPLPLPVPVPKSSKVKSPQFPLSPGIEASLFHMFDKDYLRKGATMAYMSNTTKMPVYVKITDVQVTADVYAAQPNPKGKWGYSKTQTTKFPIQKLDGMYFVDEDEFKRALRT